MRIAWYNIVLASILSAGLFLSFSKTDEGQTTTNIISSEDIASDRDLPQIVQSVVVNKEYNFAGERLPTEEMDVRERLERELLVNSYRHSSTIQYLKLMPRYFPLVENILRQEGLPDDFKYLAVAESGLRMAVSPSGAKGLWQFLKGTAQEYGLTVTSEVDERYHVEESTRAACTYLKKLKEQFGSWTLAGAAYNMGQNALSRDMKYQKESTYYNLNLSRETMRYIFRIVALKEIHQHAHQYGFFMEQSDLYKPMDNVHLIPVESSIESLADLAHQYGSSYRELKMYNPWLLNHKLTNTSGKKYYIQLPRK